MVGPWGKNEIEFRDEVASRGHPQPDDVGPVDASCHLSPLDFRSHLSEDIEVFAPTGEFSRESEFQIDLNDRISGNLSPEINTKRVPAAAIAAVLLVLVGFGWMAASKPNLLEGSPAPVSAVQAPPLNSILTPAKSDRQEIKSTPSNLAATTTLAPIESIGDLLM